MTETIPATFEVLDERFRGCRRRRAHRAAVRRLPLGGRAGLRAGRRVPGVERHPQRPHAALGRDDRRGRRVPPAVPATPTATRSTAEGRLVTLRARQPARDPDRARRLDHGARRPLRRQAAQQPQRRRRALATARSGSPTPPTASTATTRATGPRARSAAATSTAIDPSTGACTRRRRRLRPARTASRSRSTSGRCTSPTRRRNHIRGFAVDDDGAPVRRRGVRRVHGRRASTASASTRRAASGRRPATACTASTPTAR